MLKGSNRESSTQDLSGPFRLSELEYLRRLNAALDVEYGPPDPDVLAWVTGEIENARIKYLTESSKGGSGE